MKRHLRFIALLLICSTLMVAIANATTIEPRESEFFLAHSVFAEKEGTSTFEVWFDVTANVTTMDELGASEIHIYRSADGDSWTKVRSYYKEDYPSMICLNTASHVGHITYTGAWSGYYYRASVILYAKVGNNIGEKTRYTDIIRM